MFLTVLNEDFFKTSINLLHLLGALTYFATDYEEKKFYSDKALYDSLLIMAGLALDYAEEKDAYVETFLISSNPTKKKELMDSKNEKGTTIKTREELEAWIRTL